MNRRQVIDGDRTLEFLVSEYGKSYGNCAQASFHALHDWFRLGGDAALFVRALRFLPGIAGTQETCGAVSGCLLALGLAGDLGEAANPRPDRKTAHEFCVRVREELGSTRCGDILERLNGRRFDLMDPDQMREYMESGAGKKCVQVVQAMVGIAAGMIGERAAGPT